MSKLKDILNYTWSGISYGCLTYFVAVLRLVLFIERTVARGYNTVKRWVTFNRLEIAFYTSIFILTLLLFGCTWKNGYEAGKQAFSDSYVTDTAYVINIVHDTITIVEPKPVTKTVFKRITDTLYLPQDDCWKIAEVSVDDLYYRQDSLYELWLKGAYVQLDSVKVFPKAIYQTERIQIKQKRKPWGIGLSAGYGITGSYIGIGIQYNVLQW